MCGISSSFQPTPASSMINQDATDNLRCGSEKVSAVAPIHTALIDEPDVSLINQCRGLQCVIRTFRSHMLPGQTAQLVIE